MPATLNPPQHAKKKKPPKPKFWTYEEYLNLPDDGKRYEIIEGELFMANAPNSDHQFIVTELARLLGNVIAEKKLGRLVVAPFEVHLSEATRPVQPDILFVKKERWPGGKLAYYEGAPDLIVEVLSPTNVRLDRSIKFSAYEKAGVSEYWIINPKKKIIEVYTLNDQNEYEELDEYSGTEIVKSKLLPDLEFEADSIFA